LQQVPESEQVPVELLSGQVLVEQEFELQEPGPEA
jgi:hypothetical protein